MDHGKYILRGLHQQHRRCHSGLCSVRILTDLYLLQHLCREHVPSVQKNRQVEGLRLRRKSLHLAKPDLQVGTWLGHSAWNYGSLALASQAFRGFLRGEHVASVACSALWVINTARTKGSLEVTHRLQLSQLNQSSKRLVCLGE